MLLGSGNKDFSWMQDGAGSDKLSAEMQASYESVAQRADETQHLHVIDRFPITLDAWDTVCRSTSQLLDIKADDSMFDAGCGCGAWLESVARQFPEKNLKIAGLDYAPGLIDIANQRIPNGEWHVGDARKYEFIPDNSFDVSVSFGVFVYFDSQDECRTALEELVRVTKPGGRIMVGRMNSKEIFDRLGEEHIRKNYAKYVPRQCKVDSGTFWHEEAERLGLQMIAVKQMGEMYDIYAASDSAMGSLRHCVFLQKPM